MDQAVVDVYRDHPCYAAGGTARAA